MIYRVADPLDESEREPQPGSVRITFDTKELMRRAGIASDMSDTADERYIEYLSALSQELGDGARIRATGYRYGPAAGDADTAFIDLVMHGVALAQTVQMVTTALRWLRNAGALEIRISSEAAEKLGRWELERRGVIGPELVSQQLVRARRVSATKYDGFALVYRLPDSRLATVSLSVDGILRQLSVADEAQGPSPSGATEPSPKDRLTANDSTRGETGSMARIGDTRLFKARPFPPGALTMLGRRFEGLFEGSAQVDLTRTARATDDEVAALTDLANEHVKVHIALDAPRTPTVTIEGSGDTVVVSVTGMGGAQFDLIYALVRETLGLGEDSRLTGPDSDANI